MLPDDPTLSLLLLGFLIVIAAVFAWAVIDLTLDLWRQRKGDQP